MSDARLWARARDPKWTVLRARTWPSPPWSVFKPGRENYDRDFPTHAEAIAYAQAQARKEP